MSDLLVVGHVLSQDNPWIPLMTVAGIALLVVFVLAAVGRLRLEEPGDLLLPLASVVLLAGLSGSLAQADWLLDQGPWIVPAGIVVLVAIVVVAFSSSIEFAGPTSRTTLVVLGVAAVAAVGAFGPLDQAWFGETDQFAVERGPAEVTMTVVEPPDAEGRFVVEVTVDGGTIGDGTMATSTPDDPLSDMFVRFYVNSASRFPAVPDDCAAADDCTTARFELFHPADTPLERVRVEFLTANQLPFAQPLDATLTEEQLSGQVTGDAVTDQ